MTAELASKICTNEGHHLLSSLASKKVLETASTLLVFSLASTKGLKTAFKMAAVTVSKMDRWLGYKLGIDEGAEDGIVTCLALGVKVVGITEDPEDGIKDGC